MESPRRSSPSDPSDPSGASAAVLAPHPELNEYYDGSKKPFVRRMFDHGAADYDRVERMMAFGTGSWYRRQALQRAGLTAGMRVLDVAVGTGLVAREAVTLAGDANLVVGVDPSTGMLAEARKHLTIRVVQGTGEQIPLASGAFDFVSMGYALRHLSDLNATFREFFRVLKPGGTLCVLELTRMNGRVKNALLRTYMRYVVPRLTRLRHSHEDTSVLWKYYWDTIEFCVPPERVMRAIADAGFVDVARHTELGMFSEYTGRKAGETSEV